MIYPNTTDLESALIDQIIDREKINNSSLNLEQLTETLCKTDYYNLQARLIKLNESNVTEAHPTLVVASVTVIKVTKAETLLKVKDLPTDWLYTPNNHDKKPLLTAWQNNGIKKSDIGKVFMGESRWKAIGVLSGTPSGGLLFLDRDGSSTDRLVEEFSGKSLEDALPKTVTVTSGRAGRCQHVYQVPEEYWDSIATTNFKSGVKGPDGELEQLEFFWDGHQSVVIGEHPKTGSYRWVNSPSDTEVAIAPVWMIEKMIKDVPVKNVLTDVSTKTKAPKPLRLATEVVSMAVDMGKGNIPLIKCINPAYRDFIETGIAEGGRNCSAFKVAVDLIGTEEYLTSIGQNFVGSAKELYEKYCQNCKPVFGGTEADTTWRSALKDNPKPCLDDHKIQGCIEAWYRTNSSLTADEIRNYTPEEPTRFSWDSVREGFPADITEAYEKANSYRAIEADVVALTLITTLSAELGGLCDTDSESALNIWAVIVGVSGSGKSGKISAVTKGLSTINSDRLSLFKEENSQYKKELRTYETQRKELTPDEELEEPVAPTLNSTIIQSITGEKLLDVLQTQESKSRGLLGIYDEFKTFLGGIGKYNQGSDEESRYLTIQSGEHVQADTKTHGRVSIERPKLSVIGGIQPVVLMQHVGKTGKESGFWARLLLAKTCESKVVHRFDREASKAKFLQLIVEKYVSKIQQISGQLRSEMTEETIDLRFETGEYFLKELEVTANRECVLKTIDYIDRVATVLSLLEYLYLGLSGDLAPVYPHHYKAALALCENSLSIWEELTHVDIEKNEAELVQKAYKIGLSKKKLDAKILQNWVKGDKAQNIIKLVCEAYGGTLTTGRQKTFTWTP